MKRMVINCYIVVVVACIIGVIQCLFSQPVCKLNQTTQECEKHPEAIIQLLTKTGYDFAYMLRCEYAYSQNTCNNISHNTCIWAQGSCRVSSRYLVNTISQCISGNYQCGSEAYSQDKSCNREHYEGEYFKRTFICKQDLEDSITGYQWIDVYNMQQRQSCRRIQNIIDLGTCELIKTIIKCHTNNQNFYQESIYDNTGQELIIAIRYLLQKSQSHSVLNIEYLENMLDIVPGNLQIFQYCDTLNKTFCENTNVPLQKLIPLLPKIKHAQYLNLYSLNPNPILSPIPSPLPPSQFQRPVCNWDYYNSTCQKNHLALMDLLTDTNSTFGYMMRCQLAETEIECLNLQNNSCVWENNSCSISSVYLVNSITECFFPQSNGNLVSFCSKQLQNIARQHTWINKDMISQPGICYQSIDKFQFKSPSCKLMEVSLQCGQCGQACKDKFKFSYDFCDTNPNILVNQIIGDLAYLMNENSNSKFLKLSFLEESLNILEGNLQLYENCEILKNKYDCEQSTQVPSPTPILKEGELEAKQEIEETEQGSSGRGISQFAIIGIVISILLLPICLLVGMRKRIMGNIYQQERQGDRVSEPQILASEVGGEGIELRTQAILDNLPTVEYRGGAGTSLITCMICLDEITEGKKGSTVLPCMHWFHRECFEKWIQMRGSEVTCPLCNQRLLDNLT